MSEALAVILTAIGTALLTGFINVAIVSRFLGKFEGSVMERLEGHDADVKELKNSRSEQWEKINGHGERITWLEAKANGKH